VQNQRADQQSGAEQRGMNPVAAARASRSFVDWGLVHCSLAPSILFGLESEFRDGNSELAHLLLEALPVHSGPLGRARNIAAGGTERAHEKRAFPVADKFFLRLAEGHSVGSGGRRDVRVSITAIARYGRGGGMIPAGFRLGA